MNKIYEYKFPEKTTDIIHEVTIDYSKNNANLFFDFVMGSAKKYGWKIIRKTEFNSPVVIKYYLIPIENKVNDEILFMLTFGERIIE